MIRTPLRDFQKEAVERALPFDGFLLFPEQRTGKCLTALTIVDKRKPKNLWILCPIQAITTWLKQIAEHLEVDWDCDLVIINWEELTARRKQYFRETKKLGRNNLMIIGDELHKIKRRGTKVSRAARTLAKRAKWKLGLTGTPIGQGIQDAWALMDFVDPKIFGPFSSRYHKKTKELLYEGFEDKHLIWGGFGDFKIIGTRDEETFYEKLHSRSYRITLREARGKDLPLTIRFRKIWFELSDSSRELYEELEEEMSAIVNQKKVKIPVVVALSMKLQQITGGYIKDSEEGAIHKVGSEKMRQLLPIVKRLKAEDVKFVVVFRFIHEMEAVAKRLRKLGITTKFVRGGEPYDHKFDVDGILIQVQSGVAVDMSLSDHTIFYSPDFSYLNYEQVKFRILNWTKKFASFYFLLGRDTIDEQIYQTVTRKKNLAQLVLDKYRKQKHDGKSRVEPGRRRSRNG